MYLPHWRLKFILIFFFLLKFCNYLNNISSLSFKSSAETFDGGELSKVVRLFHTFPLPEACLALPLGTPPWYWDRERQLIHCFGSETGRCGWPGTTCVESRQWAASRLIWPVVDNAESNFSYASTCQVSGMRIDIQMLCIKLYPVHLCLAKLEWVRIPWIFDFTRVFCTSEVYIPSFGIVVVLVFIVALSKP